MNRSIARIVVFTTIFFATAASAQQAAPPAAQTAQQPAAPQAPPPAPCSGPEARQFDFWVGDWNLTWPNPKGGEALHGTNHVTRDFDGCVTTENFDGGTAIPLRGHSVSVYNARLGKWQQTWVDNQGGYIDIIGEFRDGQMVLGRENALANGNKVNVRMVYKNIKPDSFDWSWERSTDGGQTWQVLWPIHYARKN